MFGLSLAEIILVAIVALIFIKPQDLPEIAHFLGRMFYRAKKLFGEIKKQFKTAEHDLGISDLKHELNRGIAEEKAKIEDDFTIIVDMDGNEHKVPNVKDLRSDLSSEEIKAEIESLNKINSNQKPTQE